MHCPAQEGTAARGKDIPKGVALCKQCWHGSNKSLPLVKSKSSCPLQPASELPHPRTPVCLHLKASCRGASSPEADARDHSPSLQRMAKETSALRGNCILLVHSHLRTSCVGQSCLCNGWMKRGQQQSASSLCQHPCTPCHHLHAHNTAQGMN
jgi:hypothetical protein